jgi:uncharacterized protein (DUF2249 family)
MTGLRLPRQPGEQWLEADGVHVEVRGLAPPGPLVTIVRLIESLKPVQNVTVHHDRDPQLLYAELAERGWRAERIAGDAGEFRLRLVKDAA